MAAIDAPFEVYVFTARMGRADDYQTAKQVAAKLSALYPGFDVSVDDRAGGRLGVAWFRDGRMEIEDGKRVP